jgi:hypothetical protein
MLILKVTETKISMRTVHFGITKQMELPLLFTSDT